MGGGGAEITIFLAYPHYKSKGTVQRSILNMFWTKALIIVILVSHPIKIRLLAELFYLSTLFFVCNALISLKPNKPCCNLTKI